MTTANPRSRDCGGTGDGHEVSDKSLRFEPVGLLKKSDTAAAESMVRRLFTTIVAAFEGLRARRASPLQFLNSPPVSAFPAVGLAARAAPGVLVVLLGCLYLAMRPLVLYVSDSYANVNTVESPAYGFFIHPHHVLYLPLAWRWTQLVHWLAPTASTWTSMTMMSAFFGCLGVAALYLTLRVLGARRSAAVAGAALPAFAFGYWFFASTAKTQTIEACCVMWSLYFLARMTVTGRSALALWAGVAAGFAAALHQTGILMFVPAAMTIILTCRRISAAAASALFTLGFGAIVAPSYIAGAWAALPALTPTAFVKWLFLFAREGYGGFSWATTPKAPFGMARGLVGGQAVLDWLRGAHRPDVLLWIGLAATVAVAASGGVLVVKSLRRAGALPREAGTMALVALSGFAAYGVFSVYFDPANFEWWTTPMPILALAVAIPALSVKQPSIAAVAAVATALFAANFCLDFSHRRDPHSDFILNAARETAAVTTSRDVIVAPTYLATLIWYEHQDRDIFCPDKEILMRGADGMRRAMLAEASAAGTRGGRIVIAGADRDDRTAAFTREILSGTSESDRTVIGRMVFLDGGRRLVQTVGQVDIVAVRPACVAGAFVHRDVAQVEGVAR